MSDVITPELREQLLAEKGGYLGLALLEHFMDPYVNVSDPSRDAQLLVDGFNRGVDSTNPAELAALAEENEMLAFTAEHRMGLIDDLATKLQAAVAKQQTQESREAALRLLVEELAISLSVFVRALYRAKVLVSKTQRYTPMWDGSKEISSWHTAVDSVISTYEQRRKSVLEFLRASYGAQGLTVPAAYDGLEEALG